MHHCLGAVGSETPATHCVCPGVSCCASLVPSPLCAAVLRCCGLVSLRRAVFLDWAVSGARCPGAFLCAVLFPVVYCGVVLRCAAWCEVCCAAARCAVFSCDLSCCAVAPLVRCCIVLCWRACVVLLCCALLRLWCWAASCGVACGLRLFAVGPRCPSLCPGGTLRRWCPWLVRFVSCCWWWFVVVPCSPVLCPAVLSLHVVLCCHALRSIPLCCLCLFALVCLKNHCQTWFVKTLCWFFLAFCPCVEYNKENYTQPNSRASTKTMYPPQPTCRQLLATVCSCCWRRCQVVVAGLVCKGLTAFPPGPAAEADEKR